MKHELAITNAEICGVQNILRVGNLRTHPLGRVMRNGSILIAVPKLITFRILG